MKNRYHCCGRRRGFTLIELLVVIVILGILMALIFPALSGVLRSARKARCAANLSQIYRAWQSRIDDGVNYRLLAPVQPIGWAGILMAYLDNSDKVFHCPEDTGGHYAGINGMGVHRSLGSVRGTIPFDPGRYFDARFFRSSPRDNKAAGAVCGAACRVDAGTWGRDTWELRHSVNQGTTAGAVCDTLYSISLTDKTIACTQVQGDSPYCVSDGTGRNVLITFVPPNLSATPPVPGNLNIPYKIGMVDKCSYGMNDHVVIGKPGKELTELSVWSDSGDCAQTPVWRNLHKVLVMEYTNVAVWATQSNSFSWGSAPYPFARHNDKCNVLFLDGTVALMDPVPLNPADPVANTNYWAP